MISLICFAPPILIIIYSLYLLIKPKDKKDEFFHLSQKAKKETILERIKLLEEINDADYSRDKIEIEKYYRDGRITESEASKMEKIITNTFFDNFKTKWKAFKSADTGMKILFLFLIVYGFVYVNLVFIAGYKHLDEFGLSLEITLLIINASLLLPYLFSLTLLGFLSTFLAMLNLRFSERGGINRAAITSEELVKALKPGGRKTQIVLGSAWSKTFFRL